jgi:hypothetical protein
MTGLAMLFGGGFGVFKLVRRYRQRAGYALSNGWGRGIIGASAFFSVFIYICLQLSGFHPIPGGAPALNSVFMALGSALCSVGALAITPITSRDRSGTRVLVTASTWLNEILEKETDRVVAQKVTEIALEIEIAGVSVVTLQAIGNHLIQFTLQPGAKRSAQLARLDALAGDRNVAGLIRHLMEYCAPQWLAETAKDHTLRLASSQRDIEEIDSASATRK